MAEASGSGNRDNNFAGIRLLAALATLLGHVALLTGHADPFHSAGLRLQVFFAVSGFLIAASWAKDPDIGRFLAKRFLRIYPAYAVLIVVCACTLLATSPEGSMRHLAAGFYFNNLWFHGFDWAFFPTVTRWDVNDSIWALPVEVGLYAIFTAVACMARPRRESLLFAGFVAWWFGWQADAWMLRFTFEFGTLFLCGVLLQKVRLLRRTRWVLAAAAAGLALGSVEPLCRCLVIAPAAVWIGSRAWPVLRRADRFGDFSLGLFLWHWPVLQFVVLPWHRSYGESMLATVLISLAVAALQWHAVERPMSSLKPLGPAGRRRREALRVQNAACRKPPSIPITPQTATTTQSPRPSMTSL